MFGRPGGVAAVDDVVPNSRLNHRIVIHTAVGPAGNRHRFILNFEAEAEGITTDHVVSDILRHVPHIVDAVNA